MSMIKSLLPEGEIGPTTFKTNHSFLADLTFTTAEPRDSFCFIYIFLYFLIVISVSKEQKHRPSCGSGEAWFPLCARFYTEEYTDLNIQHEGKSCLKQTHVGFTKCNFIIYLLKRACTCVA